VLDRPDAGEFSGPRPGPQAQSGGARILQAFELALAPIAGARAVLDALPLGRCVASSSHPEGMRRSLELAGLPDRFAPRLFSASMVSEGTPAPDLFLLAAARMAAEPARCLVIEDSPAGNRAGKAAGMTAFGFTGGSHLRPETHAPDCGRRAQIPCSPR
jgi:HAD superfamily hydrolase (TIGR01509 family)